MEWWRSEGWPTAEEWQAVWGLATFVVAVVAAIFALVQYRASVRSGLEQARPYVIVDFHFLTRGRYAIEVKNTGLTGASDIRFSWSDPPRAENPPQQAAIDQSLVNGSIPFLAPGRALRFLVGTFEERTEQRRYHVTATYEGSGEGKTWTSSSTLDLNQWAKALVDRDPYESVAKPLRELAEDVRRRRRPRFEVPYTTRAAESLYAYLEAQPEVKEYRERQASAIAEDRRRAQLEFD